MASPEPRLPDESAEEFDARMKASGMKLVRIWVADPDNPDYAREARRQAVVIANSPQDDEDLDFVDSLAEEAFTDLDSEEA